MISVRAGDTARDRLGGYAEAPKFHLHGDSDDDQEDRIFRIGVNCSEQGARSMAKNKKL